MHTPAVPIARLARLGPSEPGQKHDNPVVGPPVICEIRKRPPFLRVRPLPGYGAQAKTKSATYRIRPSVTAGSFPCALVMAWHRLDLGTQLIWGQIGEGSRSINGSHQVVRTLIRPIQISADITQPTHLLADATVEAWGIKLQWAASANGQHQIHSQSGGRFSA